MPIDCSAWPTAASKVVVRLKMEAHFEADAESANVVGEIRGRELPDEVVVVSGHLDSWDVGAGATDDGGGCVVTWEALRHHEEAEPAAAAHGARRAVDQRGERRPRRASPIAISIAPSWRKHVMMLESDGGVFRPLGFGFTGSDAARETVQGDRHAA